MRPKLEIDLSGPDGNVYAVVSRCCTALKKVGKGDTAAELKSKAFEQRSYDAVLELCRSYVDVTFLR